MNVRDPTGSWIMDICSSVCSRSTRHKTRVWAGPNVTKSQRLVSSWETNTLNTRHIRLQGVKNNGKMSEKSRQNFLLEPN